MWRRFAVATLALCLTSGLTPSPCLAQQDEPEAKRKVVSRVTPVYPEMARMMNLKGVVKMDALVAPNGTVKSLEVRGGHPALVQAAENAILKWKWEPAAHDTKEPVEVKFNPQ